MLSSSIRMLPLLWSPTMFSLSLLIAILPNGCSAGGVGALAGVGPASVMVKQPSSRNMLASAGSLNSPGKGNGGSLLPGNSLKLADGVRHADGIVAQGAGHRLQAIHGQSASAFATVEGGNDVPTAKEIKQNILERIYLRHEAHEVYGNNEALEKTDEKAIHEVTDIFEKMPAELRQKRAKFVEDAGIAQIAYNRFKDLAANKQPTAAGHHPTNTNGHQDTPDEHIFDIFSLAWDVAHNLKGKVEKEIEIVEKAIQFYQLGKDPEGFDVVNMRQEESEVEGKLKEKIDEKMKQMNAFQTWLKHVSEKIIGNSKENEAKLGRAILQSLLDSHSHLIFDVHNNGSTHGKNGEAEEEEAKGEHHKESHSSSGGTAAKKVYFPEVTEGKSAGRGKEGEHHTK